jgi:hypothetical protein
MLLFCTNIFQFSVMENLDLRPTLFACKRYFDLKLEKRVRGAVLEC